MSAKTSHLTFLMESHFNTVVNFLNDHKIFHKTKKIVNKHRCYYIITIQPDNFMNHWLKLFNELFVGMIEAHDHHYRIRQLELGDDNGK